MFVGPRLPGQLWSMSLRCIGRSLYFCSWRDCTPLEARKLYPLLEVRSPVGSYALFHGRK